MRELDDDLIAFLNSGVSMLAASRDAQLRPAASRAVGIKTGEDRGAVTVFLSNRAGAEVIALLAPGVPFALSATLIATFRTVQLKGNVVRVRPAVDDERPLITEQAGGFTSALSVIGMPLPVVRALVTWPATAVEVRLHSLFEQTPGPGAGRPMVAR